MKSCVLCGGESSVEMSSENGDFAVGFCRDCADRFADFWRPGLSCEQLVVQLAGCSVAALGGISPDQLAQPDSYGWSPAYQDVLELRRKYEVLFKETKGADQDSE